MWHLWTQVLREGHRQERGTPSTGRCRDMEKFGVIVYVVKWLLYVGWLTGM